MNLYITYILYIYINVYLGTCLTHSIQSYLRYIRFLNNAKKTRVVFFHRVRSNEVLQGGCFLLGRSNELGKPKCTRRWFRCFSWCYAPRNGIDIYDISLLSGKNLWIKRHDPKKMKDWNVECIFLEILYFEPEMFKMFRNSILSSKKFFMGVSSCYVRDWVMHHSKVNRM